MYARPSPAALMLTSRYILLKNATFKHTTCNFKKTYRNGDDLVVLSVLLFPHGHRNCGMPLPQGLPRGLLHQHLGVAVQATAGFLLCLDAQYLFCLFLSAFTRPFPYWVERILNSAQQ